MKFQSRLPFCFWPDVFSFEKDRASFFTATEQKTGHEAGIIKQQPQIQMRICEALKSVNNDAKDIAKIVCAALIPLSVSGVIALPLTPIVCFGVGLVIRRAGTSGFCAGVSEQK